MLRYTYIRMEGEVARILVVDDDPDILKMAEQVLGNSGHTVLVAQDALRAIDWLSKVEFDLLLSDANMPHYSGFELVATVRNNERYRNMAIAMLTGLRERKDVERAAKLGIDDYIIKPLDPILLVQKVNSLFERRRPSEHPEVRLDGSKTRGEIRWPIKVLTVSELGLLVECDFPVRPGMVLNVSLELFDAIGVEAPPLKVLYAESSGDSGIYHARMIFFGASENVLHRIRRWVYSHGGSYLRNI